MAVPSMSFGQTLHASASLAASGTTNDTLDLSAAFGGAIIYKITAAGSVAATFGLKVEVYKVYSGTTYPQDNGTGTLSPYRTITQVGYAASQIVYTIPIDLNPSKYKIKITNLDATNAITVEGMYESITGVA